MDDAPVQLKAGASREQLQRQIKHVHTLYQNSKLKLQEKIEQNEQANARIDKLENTQEIHVAKISALMTVKELSVELQGRLGFSNQQLEQVRTENETLRTDLRVRTDELRNARNDAHETHAKLNETSSRFKHAEEELLTHRKMFDEKERNFEHERTKREHAHQRLELQETHTSRIHREKNELEAECANLTHVTEELRKDLGKVCARHLYSAPFIQQYLPLANTKSTHGPLSTAVQ